MQLYSPDTLGDITRAERHARPPTRVQAATRSGATGHGADHHGGGHDATPPPAETPPKIDYDKSKLFASMEVSLPTESNRASEKAEITDKTLQSHALFLEKYIEGLKKMQRDYPTQFNDPSLVGEREFMAHLLNADGDFDKAKATGYLKTPDGLMHSMVLMDQKIFDMGAVMAGEYASLHPNAQRDRMPQFMTIQTHIDEGRIRHLRNRIGAFLRQPIGQIAGRADPNAFPGTRGQAIAGLGIFTGGAGALGAAVGWLAGGPLGSGIGGLTGTALMAGGAYIGYENRQGLQLNLQSCREVYENVQHDPVRTALMRSLTGINAGDFIVNGGQVVPNGAPESSSIYRAEKDLRNLLQLRQTTKGELGIPPHMVNGQTEQDLIQGLLSGRESGGTRLEDRIEELYNRNHPAYNPADIAGNLARYNEARRVVLTEHLRRQIADKLTRQRNNRGPEAHAAKIKAMDKEGGGRYKAAQEQIDSDKKARKALIEVGRQPLLDRIGPVETRKNTNEIAKGILEGEKNALDVYTQKVEDLRNNRHHLEVDILTDTLGNSYTERTVKANLEAFLRNPPGSIAPGIPPTEIIVDGLPIKNPLAEQERLRIDRQNRHDAARAGNPQRAGTPASPGVVAVPGETDANYAHRIQKFLNDADRIVDAQLQLIETQTNRIQQLLTEITTTQTNIRTSENALRILPEVAKATEYEGALRANFENIINIGTVPGVTLDRNVLANHSISDVFAQINMAHAANPALGWPEAENSNPERIREIVQAKVEARASITAPSPAFDTLNNPANFGITEHQLRSLSTQEIISLCNDRLAIRPAGAAAITIPGDTEITRARLEANTRFINRRNALNVVLSDLQRNTDRDDAELVQVNAAILQINNAQLEIDNEPERISFTARENLEIAVDFMGLDKDKLSNLSFLVVQQPNRFTDPTPLDPADPNFSDVEKTAAGTFPEAHRGYFELLRLLTNYHEKPDRDQYLQKLMRVLPPSKLADILDQSVVLPNLLGAPTPGVGLNVIFGDLNRTIATDRSVGATEIMQGFRAIIRRLDDEADAI